MPGYHFCFCLCWVCEENIIWAQQVIISSANTISKTSAHMEFNIIQVPNHVKLNFWVESKEAAYY